MADSLALVGETEAALDAVQRMIELGIVNYPFLAEHEPFFSRLRSEPRFGQLMEQTRERWNAFEP
jgi:pentatricopeptide repeat protein